MPADFDIFFSYAHADKERAQPFVSALREAGLDVWFDEKAIETFEPITQTIHEGIARSKALVAFYSATYPQRRACQWELTNAFVSCQLDPGGVRRRIMVVNPEPSSEHIEPSELRDLKYALEPTDAASREQLARLIAERVALLDGQLGDLRSLTTPRAYGLIRPRGSPRFVGRVREMWQLHSALQGQRTAVVTGHARPDAAQLVGMGGNGKSLLAEEYALRFGAAYPGGIFWIGAHGNDGRQLDLAAISAELDFQIAHIAELLGISCHGLRPAQVMGAVERQLDREAQSCLWIVDDLPSGMSRPQFDAWLPRAMVCKTLVTTRTRAYGAWSQQVDLSVLQCDEAVALFEKHLAGERFDRNEVQGIVQLLGSHALAVDVAGGYAKGELAEGRTLAAVLRDLQQSAGLVLEDDADLGEQLPNGHEKSIIKTLRLSIEQLGEEARDVLRVTSWLAVAPIPIDLLDRVLDEVDSAIGTDGKRRGKRGRKQAEERSLLESGGGSISVHGLVKRAVRAIETDRGRLLALGRAAMRVLSSQLSLLQDGRAPGHFRGLVVHARELVGSSKREEALTLLAWVAKFDLASGEFASARVGYTNLLQRLTRAYGPNHPDALNVRQNLAGVLFEQGDLPSARAHQDAVVEALCRVVGPKHADTLTARSNLAAIMLAQGELAAACREQKLLLMLLELVHGADRPETLTARLNLAESLRAQGDLVGAREHQEAVFEVRMNSLGGEHLDTLIARQNLAETLREEGELERARTHQEMVFGTRSRILGEDHPDTLGARGNLALTLLKQRELALARSHQEAVLRAYQLKLGAEHPHTITARDNLAGTLFEQGDLASARALQEVVLEARVLVLGARHPDTLAARRKLVMTLLMQRDLPGARAQQEGLFETLERELGPEHPDTLTLRNDLATTLAVLGEFSLACSHLTAVLEARVRVLGPEHPDTLITRQNLAQLHKVEVAGRC